MNWTATLLVAIVGPAEPDDDRLDEIEERLDQLEDENEELRENQEYLEEQMERRRRFGVHVGGYLDSGLFWAQASGAGVRSDIDHGVFPEYAGIVPDQWVFAGDPLSTAINSRGEPADTGGSRAIGFDSVDSRGKTSFIVNALNLQFNAALGERVGVATMIDFVPRGREVARSDGLFLGDFIDLKLAYLHYAVPTRRFDFDIYFGKVDSAFGYEYRIQEAPNRIEVTPSLLCRYTCGRPIGLKTRFQFAERRLNLALAATNGSSYQETFAFYDEVDRNLFKTLTGRLGAVLPVGAGLELGASGQFGAQDVQADDLVFQWQHGFDVHLDVRGFELTAEVLQGRARGKEGSSTAPCDAAPCLRVLAAYGLAGYRALNWLMPYVRVDFRDALHQSGSDFVYISQLVRLTPGIRFDIGQYVTLKGQYTVNREVGRVPQIRNDTFTSSVVAHF